MTTQEIALRILCARITVDDLHTSITRKDVERAIADARMFEQVWMKKSVEERKADEGGDIV